VSPVISGNHLSSSSCCPARREAERLFVNCYSGGPKGSERRQTTSYNLDSLPVEIMLCAYHALITTSTAVYNLSTYAP
jgi:hypothetical protein